MPAVIYIYSQTTLKEPRGGLEDDLDDALSDLVEVTGGGGGARGWNVDLEVCEGVSVDEAVRKVSAFLRRWGVPQDTYMKVFPADWVEGQEPQQVAVFGGG